MKKKVFYMAKAFTKKERCLGEKSSCKSPMKWEIRYVIKEKITALRFCNLRAVTYMIRGKMMSCFM